jgi:hypothetical protein
MKLLISLVNMLKTLEKYSVAAGIKLTIFAKTGEEMYALRQNYETLLPWIVI